MATVINQVSYQPRVVKLKVNDLPSSLSDGSVEEISEAHVTRQCP